MVFSYTTDAAGDAGLQFVTERANAERAAQTPPLLALKPADYLTMIVAGVLASYQQQAVDADAQSVRDAYIAADPDTRDSIKSAATTLKVQPGPLPLPPQPVPVVIG